MKKLIYTFFIFISAIFYTSELRACRDTVRFLPYYSFVGEDIVLEVFQFDREAIVGFQWGLLYDKDIFEFKSIELTGLISENQNLEINNANAGKLFMLIYTSNVLGTTLDNSLPLVTIRFRVKNPTGLAEFIQSPDFYAEFIHNDYNQNDCIIFDHLGTIGNLGKVSGSGQLDITGDCISDGLSLKDWKLSFFDGNKTYTRSIKENGTFDALLPNGDYVVSLLPKYDYYTNCTPPQNVTVSANQNVTNLDFIGRALTDCAIVKVDIGAPFLRRCFDNFINIRYENVGTETAENSKVKILLDDDLDVVSSSLAYTLSGDTLVYNLGSLEVDQSGWIKLVVNVDCNTTELGETHCITAFGSPNWPCYIPSNYSGSEIELLATCDEINKKVKFSIKNVGTGAMPTSKEFIVTEDDVMRPPVTYSLGVAQSYLVEVDADGKTYGLITEQEDNYPGLSRPAVFIEGCGDSASPSYGYINTFMLDDADDYIDILCLPNIGSFDPNDITGIPYGYSPKKYIEKSDRLEYKVRFQNTGTDTAFNILVRNVIKPELDLTTFKILSSSHNYSYSFIDERTLQVKFDDILLVDSMRDETNSHGYFTYEILPNKNLIDDDVIENVADIYFDFNAPVRTNVEMHTIGRPLFVSSVINTSPFSIHAYPNPVYDEIIVDGLPSDHYYYKISNMAGLSISKGQTIRSIPCRELTQGIYFIEVADISGKILGKIKIVKK
jgi:hypothetical protein